MSTSISCWSLDNISFCDLVTISLSLPVPPANIYWNYAKYCKNGTVHGETTNTILVFRDPEAQEFKILSHKAGNTAEPRLNSRSF